MSAFSRFTRSSLSAFSRSSRSSLSAFSRFTRSSLSAFSRFTCSSRFTRFSCFSCFASRFASRFTCFSRFSLSAFSLSAFSRFTCSRSAATSIFSTVPLAPTCGCIPTSSPCAAAPEPRLRRRPSPDGWAASVGSAGALGRLRVAA